VVAAIVADGGTVSAAMIANRGTAAISTAQHHGFEFFRALAMGAGESAERLGLEIEICWHGCSLPSGFQLDLVSGNSVMFAGCARPGSE
jgi:hypothetical protein